MVGRIRQPRAAVYTEQESIGRETRHEIIRTRQVKPKAVRTVQRVMACRMFKKFSSHPPNPDTPRHALHWVGDRDRHRQSWS